MKQDNSGPAFPTKFSGVIKIGDNGIFESYGLPFPGLTKREFFAAMALQGILANNFIQNYKTISDTGRLAEHCFMFADAMIEESKK